MVSSNTCALLPPTPPSEPVGTKIDSQSAETNGTVGSTTDTMTTAHKHIWVITGPAGCGKTSVAEFLHETFSIPYLEGDTVRPLPSQITPSIDGKTNNTYQFHTPENVQKMADGQPLTDADRWDWLILLREQSLTTLKSTSSAGVIVTCSALKRKYRDVIRIATYHDPSIQVHFVFLSASEALLMDRVRARKNHYMKDYMVASQFQSLETPQTDEVDVLSVDASGTNTEVQQLALGVVNEVLKKDAGSS